MAERAERVAAMDKLVDEAIRLWRSDGEACERHLWDVLTQAAAGGDEDWRLLAEAGLMVRTGEDESRARAVALIGRAKAWRDEHDPAAGGSLVGTLGEMLRLSDDPRRAVALFEQAAAELPSPAWLLQRWGMALEALGEHVAAVERFRAAADLAPEAEFLRKQEAVATLRQGDAAGAVRVMEELLAQRGPDAQTLTECGFAHLQAGQLDLAIARFEHAARLQHDALGLHYGWGMALRGQGRLVEAMARFEDEAALRPNDHETWAKWALCLLTLKQWDEAIVKARQAVALAPDSAEPHLVWGLAAMHLGRTAVGWELLNRAAVLCPAMAWPAYRAVCERLGRDPHRAWARLMAANDLPLDPPDGG